MRERKVFTNIDHVPQIWGVPYPKVFISVGLLIFSTVAGNALLGGTGTAVKMLVVAASALLSGSLHVFFMLMERIDIMEKEVSFVKNELNSQDSSLQHVTILPGSRKKHGKKKK
jgi:hypothetical protein